MQTRNYKEVCYPVCTLRLASRRERGGETTSVIRFNYQLVVEASVKRSKSPVGLGVDSCIRMLAWGCRRGSPGVFPCPTPLSGRGVAHQYNTISKAKCKAEYYRSMKKYGFCPYLRSLTNEINAVNHSRMSDSIGYTWPSRVGDDLHAERVGGQSQSYRVKV